MTNELLLIPDKNDVERDSIAQAWKNNNGEVKRISKFWENPNIDSRRITIYGNDTFSLVLAQVIGVKLVEIKDEIISKINTNWTKREINILKFSEVKGLTFPTFLKPVKPKSFRSKVYTNYDEFSEETNDFAQNEEVIQSEIIEIDAEIRVFILNNEILDLALYEGFADISFAEKFVNDFLSNSLVSMPNTYVVDVGYNKTRGWFIIEFNSSWGAGLNSCNPMKVIEGIREATINE